MRDVALTLLESIVVKPFSPLIVSSIVRVVVLVEADSGVPEGALPVTPNAILAEEEATQIA